MCNNTTPTELVDISNVTIDRTLSKNARIIEYIRQIKNPYHFKCGKFTVTAKFTENGPTLEECFGSMMI